MPSGAYVPDAKRALLLVGLMVLMGQAGYFQSGYWMNDGESAPV